MYVSIYWVARGLPTRRMCSILGLNVPVAKSTSLIGSSLSARIMCPNKVIFLCFHLVESLICLYPYLCDSSCKTAWLVLDLLTYVGGTPRILRSIFIWKLSISFCSFNVSCTDSKPYRSWLAKVLSKTRISKFLRYGLETKGGLLGLLVLQSLLQLRSFVKVLGGCQSYPLKLPLNISLDLFAEPMHH